MSSNSSSDALLPGTGTYEPRPIKAGRARRKVLRGVVLFPLFDITNPVMLFRSTSVLLASLSLIGSALAGTSAVEDNSSHTLIAPAMGEGVPVSKMLIETLGLKEGGTTPNTGLHSLLTFPTYDALILCSQAGCGGTCTNYVLSQISVDPYLCEYALYAYESAYIYTTHGNVSNLHNDFSLS